MSKRRVADNPNVVSEDSARAHNTDYTMGSLEALSRGLEEASVKLRDLVRELREEHWQLHG